MEHYKYTNEDEKIRSKFKNILSSEFKSKNQFEYFLVHRMSKDVPKYMLENFKNIFKSIKKIKLKPSIIASANSHWDNHIFKHWVAVQSLKGVPYISLEHGGSFPPKFDVMDFEEKVGYKKVVRGKVYRDNQVHLPMKKVTKFKISKSNKFCSLIGFENPRYLYRITAEPISNQVFEHFDMACNLFNSLKGELKDKFKIKPYPNVGWNSENIYKNKIGNKIIYKEKNIKKVFQMSKLIICSYPSTTLAQAMSSGLPTLLLFPERLWQLEEGPNNCFHNLMCDLKKNKIAYSDAESIASHLEFIWDDPYEWWNSSSIKIVRKKFFDITTKSDNNWLEYWVKYFNENKRVNPYLEKNN